LLLILLILLLSTDCSRTLRPPLALLLVARW
jgi:hypothetical protein